MKLMWWDKIILIMTWGKTEEKPKALSLSVTIYKYTLSKRSSLKMESVLTRYLAVKLTMHTQGLSNLGLLKKLLVINV